MATIDLGKIKQVFRGTYNNATAYVPDDLVTFTDNNITSTYICTTASTGNNPSSGGTAHANWAYIAKGVTDPIPSQSGQSGKFLKTNGSSLSFDTVSQPIRSVHSKRDGGRHTVNTVHAGNTWSSMTSYSQLETTITPVDANSKFHITGMLHFHHDSDYAGTIVITFTHGGTERAVVADSHGTIKRTLKGEHGNNASTDMQGALPIDLIVEPNTTNQIVFKVRMATFASGNPWYLNRTRGNSTDTSDGGDVMTSWTITELDGSLVTVSNNSSVQSAQT